jgi:putative Mn2+ efflux pump MntP
MPMLGWVCIHTVVQYFTAFEAWIPWIALALLSYIGIKMILDARREGECGSEDFRRIGIVMLAVQGVATSIDALSVGFTIADRGPIEALITAALIAAVTFVICLGGILIGRKVGTCLAGRAGIFGGIILIFIGLEIFITSFP